MDWTKWLLSGLKQVVYLIIGGIVTLVIAYLTASLGFKPEAGLQEWFWGNCLYPAIVALIAMLKNWWQHK